jgi:Protein of unknown function (DUF2771)
LSRRISRPVRRGLPLLFTVAAALLAGCSAPPDPNVTFYAAGQAATVGPARYCDIEVANCRANPRAAAVLQVPPGKPLQISVPAEVSAAPWQIVFRYHDNTGQRQEERTAVFAPSEPRFAYTLRLPNPTDELETAEVQQFGVSLTSPQSGDPSTAGFDFVIRGSWVLSVDNHPTP